MERNPTRRRRRRSCLAVDLETSLSLSLSAVVGRGSVSRAATIRNWLWYLQRPELQRPKHKETLSCLTTVTGILAFILNLGNREQSTMGLIRSSFSFLLETGCGIYIAQNYNVPNIKKLISTWMFVANHIEETYRKPNKDVIRRYRETIADDT
nr:PREDICTED: uncharacterized protein LOC103996817 isoform X1 [Musa acuminata subsp. malaccensis]